MSKKIMRQKTVKRRHRLEYLKRHPLVVPVATFLVLFFVTLTGFVAMGGETIGASDTRVVRLHVNDEPQVIPTRAKTVGELLERRGIEVDDKDIIEPSLDTEISADDFQINVYKARTVMVVDEGQKLVAVSAEPSPEAVAEEAGLKVYPEDIIEKAPVDLADPAEAIQDGLVTEKVVIDRATPVQINLYGKNIEVRTHAKTVGELLAEKNVIVKAGDTLKPAADTPLESATSVFVTRFGTEIETTEEIIPMPVEYIDDPNLAVGTTRVKKTGSEGRKVVTYEIKLKNGQVASKEVLQEVIAQEAVPQVVIRGTKVIISNPSANVKLGQQIAAEMGWSHQFSCIYNIFQRESGWNHLAGNANSGAYGIPQALPGSKMGPGWQSDPAVQIRWGIGYMVNRYGSPCGAEDFWQLNHWY